ncbi:MAG: bifunctional UDP-3-O-[3-hydroxymyristoyl] N-acetylglucosamine deacetylase/3-hydroxyacyl-ACP dehydratase [Fibrobacterota bacterium]
MEMQHTLKDPVSVSGVGLHTGASTTVTFKPLPENSGIVFQRTDLPGQPKIEADIDYVVSLDRGTTLGAGEARVSTIEHVMATFHGLKIDNALVEVNGEEVPLCDGSAREFVAAIRRAGVEEQHEERRFIIIEKPILYEDARDTQKALSIFPADGFHLTFMIDYNHPALGAQHTTLFSVDEFETEYAHARTFCFLSEILNLHAQGLIKGGRMESAVVVQDCPVTEEIKAKLKSLFNIPGDIFEGQNGFLNNTELRYPNELCRHKALDLLGDIYLIGAPLKAHLLAGRSGHSANIEMARKIRKLNLRPKSTSNTFVYDIDKIKTILPHRYPFLLVDRVLEIEKDKRILAKKNVTANEPFFQGHFPDYPIMPGVLQCEAMAQTGGILMADMIGPDIKNKVTLYLGIDNCRFRNPVRPGDTLLIEVELQRFKGRICKMAGRCMVGGEITCEAEFMISVMDK